VLLVATGFARMLESRDATLEVWPSTTAAMDGNPEVATLSDTPADTLAELRGSVTEDEATLSETLADKLTEPRGCVTADERLGIVEENRPGIVAEDRRVTELAMDSTLLGEFTMDSALLAELAIGNTTLEDIRVVEAVVEAVVEDPPEPPRPTDRIAEL
jgi:hypothetical protein